MKLSKTCRNFIFHIKFLFKFVQTLPIFQTLLISRKVSLLPLSKTTRNTNFYPSNDQNKRKTKANFFRYQRPSFFIVMKWLFILSLEFLFLLTSVACVCASCWVEVKSEKKFVDKFVFCLHRKCFGRNSIIYQELCLKGSRTDTVLYMQCLPVVAREK